MKIATTKGLVEIFSFSTSFLLYIYFMRANDLELYNSLFSE
jgi:hypothetical protein